ncbi:unnamed protein product, partial [Rotaria magnacalcarata]
MNNVNYSIFFNRQPSSLSQISRSCSSSSSSYVA